jgi:hypothetical protein
VLVGRSYDFVDPELLLHLDIEPRFLLQLAHGGFRYAFESFDFAARQYPTSALRILVALSQQDAVRLVSNNDCGTNPRQCVAHMVPLRCGSSAESPLVTLLQTHAVLSRAEAWGHTDRSLFLAETSEKHHPRSPGTRIILKLITRALTLTSIDSLVIFLLIKRNRGELRSAEDRGASRRLDSGEYHSAPTAIAQGVRFWDVGWIGTNKANAVVPDDLPSTMNAQWPTRTSAARILQTVLPKACGLVKLGTASRLG